MGAEEGLPGGIDTIRASPEDRCMARPTPRRPWCRSAAALALLALLACVDVPRRQDAAPADEAALPSWIWTGEPPGQDERLELVRELQVSGEVVRATLTASGDNAVEVRLDDAVVLTSGEWTRPAFVELDPAALAPGAHRLVLRCRNEGGPAAVVLRLTLERADGSLRHVVSDADWSWRRLTAGWPDGATPAPGDWQRAAVSAPLGGGPWGDGVRVRFEQAELLARDRGPLVAEVALPPGFVLETVHEVAADQGSWVGLCLLPDGRLLASDERDAGLFVIDPEARPAPTVERLDIALDGTQGMVFWRGDLYALASGHGTTPTGLYRARDTDADGLPDRVEQLTALEGTGEHGWHSLVPTPDGEGLIVVAGNNTTPPELAASRVPPLWGEDQLLPRLPDANGFMTSALAPGGCVYRVDPRTASWELLSIGYRNPFDAAFHPSGALFTYDADMEWDLNLPWYRPTRLCEVVSGSDYGWRNGSGKWPPRWPDTLPPVVDIGPGSPTGVVHGAGTAFPGAWGQAFFLADWSYGRVFAGWVEPDGAGWRGTVEPFLTGRPFPVCDLVVRPQDGCLYLVTGGRGIDGALYRVRWTGDAAEAPALPLAGGEHEAGGPTIARSERVASEALHGHSGDEQDLAELLQALASPQDRLLRHAARTALEWQPVHTWREAALTAESPWQGLPALLAVVRVSGRDGAHRGRAVAGGADRLLPEANRPLPDEQAAALRRRVVDALLRHEAHNRLPGGAVLSTRLGPHPGLVGPWWTTWLRVLSLTITRLGLPDEDQRLALLDRLQPRWPDGLDSPGRDWARLHGHDALIGAFDIDLARAAVALQAPWLAARAVPLLDELPTQEEQLALADALTHLDAGWTRDLRAAFLAWFDRAAGYAGGNSFGGTLRLVEDNALAALPDDLRPSLLAERPERVAPPSPLAALGAAFAGRDTREWTLDELLPVVTAEGPRDLARGRQLFGAAGCYACHRLDGAGGVVGPDLTAAGGRFTPRDVLEAVLDPSAVVSDLYGRTILELVDGRVLSGQVVNLVGDQLMLCEDMFRPGQLTTVAVHDVLERRPSSVSPMPEGLLAPLTADEIADLVAFLLDDRRG